MAMELGDYSEDPWNFRCTKSTAISCSGKSPTFSNHFFFWFISCFVINPVISIRWFSFDSKQDSCNFLKFHDNISILVSSTFYWFMIIYCSKIEKRRPIFSFHWFHELYVRCQMSKLTCDWPIWMLYACHFQTSKWR